MKKSMIALALVCASVLMAGEIKIDWSKAKVGDKTIPGWALDKYGKVEDLGTASIEKGSKEGTFAFALKGNKLRTAYYMTAPTKVKIGDVIKYTYRVKGTGKYVIGFFCYDKVSFVAKAKGHMKDMTAPAEWQTVTQEIEIQQPYDADRSVTMIRPQIASLPDCSVVIEDLKIEHIAK